MRLEGGVDNELVNADKVRIIAESVDGARDVRLLSSGRGWGGGVVGELICVLCGTSSRRGAILKRWIRNEDIFGIIRPVQAESSGERDKEVLEGQEGLHLHHAVA